MRRGLGFLIQAIGVVVGLLGVITAVQMAGHTPLWQVIAFGALAFAIGGGVFVAGRRVKG